MAHGGDLEADVALRCGGFALDAALRVAEGEIVALLGPNGAGKSTFVRAVAGLLPIDTGRIALGSVVLDEPASGTRLAPDERGIGVVFQSGMLFPHRSVLDNVAFGLRARGLARRAARDRARAWLDRLRIGDLAHVRPAGLSGGEAQRVALARTLAAEPAALLLDEPLSALDVEVRQEVRALLRHHLGDFPGPCLIVTHDPVEAVTLADRLVVMERGRVMQEGTVAEVTARPRTPWIARFAGANLYRGTARGDVVEVDGGARLRLAEATNGDVLVLLRPQAVTLHRRAPEGSQRNVWRGRVVTLEPVGDRIRVELDGALRLVAEVTAAAAAELDLAGGGEVWAAAKASELDVYPA